MSDCCCPPKSSTTASVALCAECGTKGRSVERRTVLHHLRSELLARVSDGDYWFCSAPACAVVYYNTCREVFTVNDVREIVTAKASGEARPICYCFGFTEGDIRREIRESGETRVLAQITQWTKEKLCACKIRNPSGACCLGEVSNTVQRLSVKGKAENA